MERVSFANSNRLIDGIRDKESFEEQEVIIKSEWKDYQIKTWNKYKLDNCKNGADEYIY